MTRPVPEYPVPAENLYCAPPSKQRRPRILVIGSGIGLACIPYLLRQVAGPTSICIAEAGPLDLLTHMAHAPGHVRSSILRAGTERVGGKLSVWGMSTPRVPTDLLRQWPYPLDDLERRFSAVELEMGVPDRIPLSGGDLELRLLSELRDRFSDNPVEVAPLAIDKDGRRWSPLSYVPALVRQGVDIISRFRCTQFVREGDRIAAVRGQWFDGRTYTLYPEIVVLAVGVEPSLPLVRQVADCPLQVEAGDHIRVDLHGQVPAGTFGTSSVEELGVAVLIMHRRSKQFGVPYHLEIKVAPRGLWARGFMQSSDNLAGADSDDTIYAQVQAVAAMHDRLPAADILQAGGTLPPVMSLRDAAFHGEIIGALREVAEALKLDSPHVCLRPLLTNHHVYGAFRAGKAVTKEFRFRGIDNLYVLPPAAYIDLADNCNPTLKSVVLAQYAMDDIARRFASTRPTHGGSRFAYSI